MTKNQSYSQHVQDSSESMRSILSVGYDPAPVNFPIEGISGYDHNLPSPMGNYDGEKVAGYIVRYFKDFLEECEGYEAKLGSFKFNLGYFNMYNGSRDNHGSVALNQVISLAKEYENVPIILDVKDADITRSSAAYAIDKLKHDQIDAITVNPYMGTDSVEPFFKFAHRRGQGIYVLTRTTNPGATDFQDLKVASDKHQSRPESDSRNLTPLYKKVAEKVVEWNRKYPGTVGSVAAGNNAVELQEVAELFTKSEEDIPLLIPGVGTQGGTATDAMKALNRAGYDHRLVRINSSSGIMYHAQKEGVQVEQRAKASAKKVTSLNAEIDLGGYM